MEFRWGDILSGSRCLIAAGGISGNRRFLAYTVINVAMPRGGAQGVYPIDLCG